MALAFLSILLALLPTRYSLPLAMALLVGYVPEALEGFAVVRPELRTVDVNGGFANTSPGGKTPFILRPAVWPVGSFTARDLPKTSSYSVIGVSAATQGRLAGNELFSVYMVSANAKSSLKNPILTIRGLEPIGSHGKALIFFENKLICSSRLIPGEPIDVTRKLSFDLPGRGPFQITVIFLQEGSSYLPGRRAAVPLVFFREISLSTEAPELGGAFGRDPFTGRATDPL